MEKMPAKANRILGFVKRIVTTFSSESKEVAYKSLVCPKFEYGTYITEHHTQLLISKLVRMQHRATFCVT